MSQDQKLEEAKTELRRAQLRVVVQAAKTKQLIRKAWRIQQRADTLRKSLTVSPA